MMSLLDRFRPAELQAEVVAARAAHIDALAPDRSGLPSLLRECSPEMERAEQRISRRPIGDESRLTALRQLLAKSARESQRIIWRS